MTYAEGAELADSGAFLNRVAFAIAIAANTIRTEAVTTANHANRLVWAKTAMSNPMAEARRIMWMLLAQHAGLTVPQATGAADSAIQTGVNNVVDIFATGS